MVVTAKAAYGLISANLFLFVETDKVIRVSFACLLIKLRNFSLFQFTSCVQSKWACHSFVICFGGRSGGKNSRLQWGIVTSLDRYDVLCMVCDFVRLAV